jgi:hypothetical protein
MRFLLGAIFLAALAAGSSTSRDAETALGLAFDALNAEHYDEAARLFVQAVEQFPEDPASADAYYWGAFARYRLGTAAELRAAERLLALQRQRFPDAPTFADAAELTLRVAGALARGGDAGSREALQRRVDGLPATCGPRSAAAPADVAALDELRTVDPGRLLPVAKEILSRNDCPAALRRRAAFLLSQARGSDIEDVLARAARSDRDDEVRRLGLYGLAQIRTATAVESLTALLAPSSPPETQVQAVLALADVGTPVAQEALRRGALDGTLASPARGEAIFRLGQRGDNSAFLRSLLPRLATEPEASTREALQRRTLFSLSQKGGDDNDRWLLSVARVARHPMSLRVYAIFAAGEAGATTEALAELYGQVSERELSTQIIDVLGARKDARSKQWTAEVAANDPQPWARERAQSWIDRKGS